MLWNERFAFNIETIDQQHKKLFDLIERAQILIKEAAEGLDCYDDIVAILNELADYTVYHFNFEEDLLAKNGYSDLDQHIIEHEEFVKKVSGFLAEDIDENHLGILTDVADFLLEWISNHVLYTDARYVSVLKTN